ncbi:MAG: hypothetical protein D6750_03665 [Bacteroidetes bacterium]|nr:MAG: hypothetical protein D6750_03665 [Bacteroidota bacterium]
MYRPVDLFRVVQKEGSVAFTIAFFLQKTQGQPAKDALWLKYSNRTYGVGIWRGTTPTPDSQIVFHPYPLQATHVVVEVYRNLDRFKRFSDLIVRIHDYHGDYYYAFIPLANLYHLQTIPTSDFDDYFALWASVDINALMNAVDNLDTVEAIL